MPKISDGSQQSSDDSNASLVDASRDQRHDDDSTVLARVLAIDDEPSILRMIKIGLQDDPFEVRTSITADEGLKVAAAWNPDVILLDLLVTDLDGYEICRRLRKITTSPIIVVTAIRSEALVSDCLDAGADVCTHKPFSISELAARVREALERRRMPLAGVGQEVLAFDRGKLRIDPVARLAWHDGAVVALGADLFRLLLYVASNPNRTVPYAELHEQLNGAEVAIDSERLKAQAVRLELRLNPNARHKRYVSVEDDEGIQFISH